MKKSNTKSLLGARSRPETNPRKTFSMDEIRKYIDPSPPEEAEEFVRLMYEERREDTEGTADATICLEAHR
jgi:hypothetical protein